ncbi:hypothetical protein HID58_021739 [Brassica napus]|uniref:Replication factor A C-terminal domain-containing protein n=2 Tax=Brassica napus TaxID=3708 RepID=A0ABQ8CX89_BRANA|nr:hypothetical protein HID58_021739 [Brassica napus]
MTTVVSPVANAVVARSTFNSLRLGRTSQFVAHIVGVLQRNEWWFVSCTSCSRKITESDTLFRCNRCVSANVTGVISLTSSLSKFRQCHFCRLHQRDDKTHQEIGKQVWLLRSEDMEVPKCLSGNEHVSQLRITPTVRSPSQQSLKISYLALRQREWQQQPSSSRGYGIWTSNMGDAPNISPEVAVASLPASLGDETPANVP